MEVIYGDTGSKHLSEPCACALGFFDGVHVGHQKLVSVLKDVAMRKNLKSIVFTFDKHPLSLIDKKRAPKLIMDNESKIWVFEKLGIDVLYFCRVSQDLLHTKHDIFLDRILLKNLSVKAIIAGFNFKFGYMGRGNSNALLEFEKRTGTSVNIVEPVFIDGLLVSSTTIREFLNNGEISMANKFLGRTYFMHGTVIHGRNRGKILGFPTANILLSRNLSIPQNGVYITKVKIDNNKTERIGITNIGYNPTFGNDNVSIETHILNFDENIYGKEIRIDFYDRIRDERKYNNAEQLALQILKDKEAAIKYFE